VRKKIRVLIFSCEGQFTACYQIRIISPFSYFPQDQFEFVYAPSLKAILKLPWLPNVVLFRRNFYPFSEVDKIVEFARSRNIITIMDIDDLVTQVPSGHPSFFGYQEIKHIMIRLMKKMDFIMVTNDRLRRHFNAYNPHTYVLPNLLDLKIWNKVNEKQIMKRAEKDKLIVGYAGSSTHKYDFKPVIPAIRYLLSKYRDKICFKFLGCIPDELRNVTGVAYLGDVINSYRQYADILKQSKFDLVISPLEDNAFNQCKSNIKFLEYSVCGFPGIYSAVGPYIDSVQDKKTGLLTENTPDSWIQSMEFLINDPKLRNNLGENAYHYVRANYLLEEGAKKWYQFYSQLIPNGQRKLAKRFSLAPLVTYAPYIAYAQLSKMYSCIVNFVKIFFRLLKTPIIKRKI